MKLYNSGELGNDDKNFIIQYLNELLNEIKKSSLKDISIETKKVEDPLIKFDDWKNVNINFQIKKERI